MLGEESFDRNYLSDSPNGVNPIPDPRVISEVSADKDLEMV